MTLQQSVINLQFTFVRLLFCVCTLIGGCAEVPKSKHIHTTAAAYVYVFAVVAVGAIDLLVYLVVVSVPSMSKGNATQFVCSRSQATNIVKLTC